MQVKDISDAAVLGIIGRINANDKRWANRWEIAEELGLPDKLP